MWQSDSNRYSRLTDAGDDEHVPWTTVERQKRQRPSIGGTFEQTRIHESQYKLSIHEFKDLSTDDKLVTLFELMTNVGSFHGRLGQVESEVHELRNNVGQNENRLKLLEYKSIDAEARNRRHNLIFRGFPDTLGEEDCEAKVKKVLAERMGIDDDMFIQRAHRLGQLRRPRSYRYRGDKKAQGPRPIIMCFRDYSDVENIISNSYKLAGTDYGVSRDYPKEIVTARSQLWPMYKAEKEKRPARKVSIGFPAKLLIEGRVVEDKFPDWFAVLRGSRHGQNFENIMSKPNKSNQRSNTAPAPNSQQIPMGPDIMRDQQPGQSDTDEEERDTALQMDTDINESEAPVHSNELSQSEHRSPTRFEVVMIMRWPR